jgi:ATP-dependent helicase/nuclease subunit A
MTELQKLEVVSAGAGSGKTYRIKEDIGQWVADGTVAPDKIAAVTFTEAAAGELRERIRSKLVESGQFEDALKLDQSFISTIHSFGLRILTEYSFDAGLPPHSRLLDKNEESALLRQAISRVGDVDTLTKELGRYGYKFDFNTKTLPEEAFRKRVASIISTLRTIGGSSASNLTSYSKKHLKNVYGITIAGDEATQALHRSINALLEQFPRDISANFEGNKTAVSEFRKNYSLLTKGKDISVLKSDWALWQSLRQLRLSKRGAETPNGYDTLASAVIECAENLPAHPGPLQDAISHAEILLNAASEAISGYAEDKKKSALVDYTDMLALAYMLIAENSGALESLASRIQCLVIDEFQDTNPLQFSMLWLLTQAGVPTLIVGDLKQAIMGFQGADPRLMESLLNHPDTKRDTLTANWRTQPSLMPFVNKVGKALFDDGYDDLKPNGSEGYQVPLEVIEHPKPPKGNGSSKIEYRSLKVAKHIHDLINDPNQFVKDRYTGEKRRLVASDIAILCPRHDDNSNYAEALRQYGIKTKIPENGWIESRVVQLVLYALDFVANPSDKHAQLYLTATELDKKELACALEELVTNGNLSSDLLNGLKEVSKRHIGATVDTLVSEVISQLDLYGLVSHWDEADKHRADLLRLEGEAKSFVNSNPESLASGGFYGSDVKTFLAWIRSQVQIEKDANRRPDLGGSQSDTVELSTWHSSKGREWSVVFVCCWEAPVKTTLPSTRVEYEGGYDDLDGLLEKARVIFTPDFSAKETKERFLTSLKQRDYIEAKRLIYVALTRARERLIIEWPTFKEGSKSDAAIYFSVLRDETGAELFDNGLRISGQTFNCPVRSHDGLGPGVPEGLSVANYLPRLGRRAIKQMNLATDENELFSSPSSIEDCSAEVLAFDVYEYSSAISFEMSLPGEEFGGLIHKCFELLTYKPSAVSDLSQFTGYDISPADADTISNSFNALMRFCSNELGQISVDTEVPFVFTDENGAVCNGIIDMLVETSEGYWIIDHKSDGGDYLELFKHYWSQLSTYRDALKAYDKPVLGVGLNLFSKGILLLSQIGDKNA